MEDLIRLSTDAANFVQAPIKPTWILSGTPTARTELLSRSEDGMASTYIWDCTAGRFNWHYTFDETLHILEGSVTLKSPAGVTRLVRAGDTIFFPTGSTAEWNVDNYIRKIAFCRTPMPKTLAAVRSFASGMKRFVTGRGRDEQQLF